ncbi:MAG: PD-(D/E)XK nuclease domain-containing protein [Bacteroidales bacterium]|jgi:hypothetical protein|nr:PD-(D/E)XK nuclease domain-containing protein [Bacteroidales bacterium]
MNSQMINASAFRYSSIFFNSEFEDILKGIIACYYSIISSGTELPNNENDIRDIMLSKELYLKNSTFKEAYPPLSNYHFDKETSENKGRADIRILHVKPYKDDDAYYVIECKRLDGGNTLNRKYITNGIKRFTTKKKYPFYNNTAGMIGFVVANIDIHQNSTVELALTQTEIVSNFEYSYFSEHRISGASNIIYHLMFNFSNNIIS